MLKYFRFYENNNLVLFFRLYPSLFCAGLVGVYVKTSLMKEYWLSIARLRDQDTIPFHVILNYFALDLLLNIILIPCLIIAISYLCFRKRALVMTTLISCLLIVFYFIQFRVQQEVGQYASSILLYEAFQFFLNNPALSTGYVNRTAIIKLLISLFVTISTSILISIMHKRTKLAQFTRIGRGLLAGIFLVSFVIAFLFYPEKTSGLHQAAVHKVITALVSQVFISREEGEGSSLVENISKYRALTKTPHKILNKNIIGSEKGSNVLYFIMETGPSDVLPDGVSELIPGEIFQNSLIAEKHHTTYPYTSDSVFSLLSGFYPEGRRRLVSEGGFKEHKGVFAQLREQGYETGVYVPNIYNAEVDEKMFSQFGFNKIFVANRNLTKTKERSLAEKAVSAISSNMLLQSPHFKINRKEELKKTLLYDLFALQRMKADILSTLKMGGNFAHIYLPQVGHGPWFKLGNTSDQKAYGRALMKLQSLWLKDIILMLKKEGALDKTIIVLTSDHGVRTKAEDPSLEVGTITSYSFHIPLVVYSPSGFNVPLVVHALTSHIDIESSIALLLGLQSEIGFTEGLPLWEASPDRRIYFFGTDYGGAEGFYDDQFFMTNVITDIQYKNNIMKFSTPELILFKEEEQNFVLENLEQFRDIHNNIMFSS